MDEANGVQPTPQAGPQNDPQLQQQQQPQQQEVAPETKVDPEVSELEQLLQGIKDHTGRQKYNDPATAINALGHSQEHIQTLEAEKRALQEQLEALQADLQARQSVEDALSNALNNQQDPQEAATTAQPLDQAALEQMVANLLQQQQRQSAAATNRTEFESKLKETYGQEFTAKVEARAAELGVPVQNVVSLAETSPKAALAMLGVGSNPTPQQPPVNQGQVNTNAASQEQFQAPTKPVGSGVLGLGSTTASTVNAMKSIRQELEAQFNQG